MTKLPAQKTHLLYLDGLRAVAALFVVVHHALLQVDFGPGPFSGVTRAIIAVFGDGHYAVDVFITLSGFCLMLPVVRADYCLTGGALLFYRKRARRILPPYFLAMGLSLVLIALFIGRKTGTHWDFSLPVTVRDVVMHVLLLQDVFLDTAAKINHVFWSISVEWRIYFLFPLLVVCWRLLGPVKTVALSLAASVALLVGFLYLRRFYPLLNSTPAGINPHYLALFTLGMFAGDVAHAKSPAWRDKAPWGALLLALSVLIPLFGKMVPWQMTDVFVGGWTVCLLVACAHPAARLHRALSWGPLVFVGTFAYSLYLIHAPLLQLVWQYILHPLHLGPLTTFLMLSLLGIPLVIAGSYGFFLACERPFLSRRKSESLVKTEINAALDPAP